MVSLTLLVAEDICMSENFHGSCPDRSVIVIQSASFGRMKLGRCIEVDVGYMGCENDVLFLADRWCSGHRKCTIIVPNEDLQVANTECNIRGLSPYLELNYECVIGKKLHLCLHHLSYTSYYIQRLISEDANFLTCKLW